MDKETLSNYGWIVICVLVLAVMMALATPFGKFVGDGFKATYEGLYQTMTKGLSVIQVTEEMKTDPTLNHNNIIPEGGTYYVNYGYDWGNNECTYDQKFEAGDAFPITNKGDRYTFGNYEYIYGYNLCDDCEYWSHNHRPSCTGNITQTSSWMIRLWNIEKPFNPVLITSAQTPLCSINNINKMELSLLCYDMCNALEDVTIYNNITNIPADAFNGSKIESINLSDCPQLTTINNWAFSACDYLTNVSLPESIIEITQGAFMDCSILTNIYFAGTKAQWNAITFGEEWNANCPEITVTCTDGTITIPAYEG